MPAKPRLDVNETIRQLGLLLDVGLNQDEAVAVLRTDPESSAVEQFLTSAAEVLEERKDLAETLGRHPIHFEPFVANLAREASDRGELAAFFKALSGYLEDLRDEMQVGLRRALFYPLVIISIATVVVAYFAVFILPQYAALFADFGAEMPSMTLVVLNFTNWLLSFFWQLAAGLIVLLLASNILGRIFDRGGLTWLSGPLSWLALKTPLLGRVVRMNEVVRVLRTWSFTLARGYGTEQALECSVAVARTSYFRNALSAAQDDVRDGMALPDALRRRRAFPRRVVQAAAVATRARAPAELFDRVADLYSEHLSQTIAPSTQRLHLILLLVTGFVVGFTVLALYLPVFKIGAVL